MDGRTGVCRDCGATFPAGQRGAVPARCPEHSRARQLAQQSRWQADRHVPVVREKTCQECGAVYLAPGRDTRSIRCPACRPSAKAAQRIRWVDADPERMAAVRRRWHEANPDKRLAARARRRAIETAPDAEVFDPVEVFERDDWICQLCGEPVDPDARHPDPWSPSLDHVVPLARGGVHTRANSQLAHFRCNLIKGDRPGR